MASCHTHATLLGGALVSSAPTKHSCTSINSPTEFTEFTEASGRGYSPTDFTDAHRLGGYGILPYPRHPLPILPQNMQNPQKRLSEIFSHGFHRCPQIRRVWHPCHTHATLCQFSHGIHRIHRSFWLRIFSHRFHRCSQMVRLRKVLWLLWENSLVGSPNLCTSVKSVGGSSPPETSVGR